LDKGGLWGFYGYAKGGYLLVGRVLRGGGAEIQFPLSGKGVGWLPMDC